MEMSAKTNTSPSTVEPALKFGPPWLRALSHGNSTAASTPDVPVPKYKLAQYRYGREEMLALFSKETKVPDCLNEFDYLIAEKCQTPLALLPVTEEEQRIWSRTVNSDMAVRGSSKGPVGPGNGMSRGGGRGGSVDRGRGRGRGGYHSRGFSYEDGEDGSLSGYSRLRPIERSQSASEKDQRWEERDRRFERPFAGRTGSVLDDTSSITKQDGLRVPSENWRRTERDEENSSWRNNNLSRGSDRFGNRGLWRNHNDRDRCNNGIDGTKDKAQQKDTVHNGPGKSLTNHPRQRSASGHFWDDETAVDNLPEWSMEDDTTTDVGTFDSSGAFLETKLPQNNICKEEIFVSDEELEECKLKEEKSQSKPVAKQKEKVTTKTTPKKATTKPPKVHSKSPPLATQKKPVEIPVTFCETELIDKPLPCAILQEKEVHVPPEAHVLPSKPFVTAPTISSVPNMLGVQKNPTPITTTNLPPPTSLNDVPAFIEEDTFAHHKTATENMVAQWTQEEEQRAVSDQIDKSIVLPVHHTNAYKWFYRDPQGEIQGPFTSNVMFEWLNGGFFTKELRIKRGCDERFVQLGELTQLWKRIPFQPGNDLPPLRAVPIVTELSTPFTQSPTLPNHTPVQFPQQDANALQQQLLQQYIFRQVQMQQAANQLKQLDSFINMPAQQQNLVLRDLQSQLLPEQQIPRTGTNTVREQPIIDQAANPPFPLLNMTAPATMLKNNLPLWSTLSQNPGSWASNRPTAKPSSIGIWDTDPPIPAPISGPIEVSELEKRMAAEEEEKHRLALEAMKLLEEENKRKEEERKEEELKRQEGERRLRELQKKQEEEKKKLEETLRLQEEERRRLEAMRKEEEQCREELRLQEERKKKEEQRLLEEQQRIRDERLRVEREEQQRREKAREELRQKEELRKQEEKRRQEEMQQKILWEQEQEKLREMEKQKEAQRLKEQEELELKMRREAAEKEQELKRESENVSRLLEQKGPAWGLQTAEKPAVEMSLSDIQKLQAQKEKEQKERLKLQQQMFQQQQQQQAFKQVQVNKNGLSWSNRANESLTSVKSLAEIQMEEAQQMAHQQKIQKTAATTVQATAASGVWGNSSQINRVSAAPLTWNQNSNCFWNDVLESTTAQNSAKTKDCAFPALSNCVKPSTNSNKNKTLRAKRDEDAVLRLFETHRKPNDAFTNWCTEALSNLPSSVDVPTFVAFLKDVDSPYDVYDYVRSYLGEGQEAKDFGKQFLEKRSKYRNQMKQSPAEENMWGPAPAITPTVNKTAGQPANDCEATICTKGKAKKKKNRMQKVDNSMLGFTVQPNPDRINIGEIDRVEGM